MIVSFILFFSFSVSCSTNIDNHDPRDLYSARGFPDESGINADSTATQKVSLCNEKRQSYLNSLDF